MYRSSLFLTAALLGTTVALVKPAVAAKSAAEVEEIARSVVVEIKLKSNPSAVGSGVLLDKKGDLYTLVTNAHVVCGVGRCSELPSGENYSLGLADGQQYQVRTSSIRLLGNNLDLAIIQFRSNRNYTVAKVAVTDSLKIDDEVYTAGFPLEQSGFAFNAGQAIALVNKRLTGDKGGYTIIYDARTLPGMSGGGVFDRNGQLVAIHGYGDRYRENTEIDNNSRVDSKIGLNRGIPVRWLVQKLAELGINLGTSSSLSGIRAARPLVPTSADEYFIAGFNKWVEPGDNVVSGKQQAIQDFSAAIRINPKYLYAYFIRAYAYEQVQEFQKSLADYNQSILINPKIFAAYNNRANLRKNKLNDIQGALSDYNQAILINPKYSSAYNNRANLKADQLNDIQGALMDYTQSILNSPKDSDAYYNRGLLKVTRLNDVKGALSDFNQAILINLKDSDAYNNRAILKADKLNDIRGGLADYNQAILINPKNFSTLDNRALLKATKLNDIQGALADYNQAILINPNFSKAYNNRAILKAYKLNDLQGALADFNQSIALDAKNAGTYNNRAVLKYTQLNDINGALSDYNQSITINPKYYKAYGGRAGLKLLKLNDKVGAIQDLRQAVKLAREQGDTQYLQVIIKLLQTLEAG
jgi:tetratricopeptide (TPR) repeat protein